MGVSLNSYRDTLAAKQKRGCVCAAVCKSTENLYIPDGKRWLFAQVNRHTSVNESKKKNSKHSSGGKGNNHPFITARSGFKKIEVSKLKLW